MPKIHARGGAYGTAFSWALHRHFVFRSLRFPVSYQCQSLHDSKRICSSRCFAPVAVAGVGQCEGGTA